MNKTIKRIKEIRAKKGWSQNKLAKISGLSSTAINNIEAGKKIARIETLIKISLASKVSIDWLCGNKK